MRRSHLVGSWVRYGTADQFQMGDFNESPFWCAFFGVNELISLNQRFECSIPPVSFNCLRTLSYYLRWETKVRQTGDRPVGGSETYPTISVL
jgi:hypothetical protein